MWARRILSGRRSVHVFEQRAPQNPIRQQTNGPHKTYFQPPPQPPRPRFRIIRTLLFGTLCAGAGAGVAVYYGFPLLAVQMLTPLDNEDEGAMTAVMRAQLSRDAGELAGRPNPPTFEDAQAVLGENNGAALHSSSIAHIMTLPSNFPCEDNIASGQFNGHLGDDSKEWGFAAIFDGHAGAQLSHYIGNHLLNNVGMALGTSGSFKRPYRPNDPYIHRALKTAFVDTDNEILIGAEASMKNEVDRTNGSALGSLAFSGSCALLALYDPVKSVLHIANVGDSRAVLGRWDEEQQRYVAIPVTNDHTGFNPNEVTRMEERHPGESPIDPKTGRTHGLAVTRAFGDARWKWAQDLNKRAHELFFGPKPLSDDKILSPPYITAEPEITDTRITNTGSHPDFLIMASDGLWDLMSNDDAVTAVQMWLDVYHPTDVLDHAVDEAVSVVGRFWTAMPGLGSRRNRENSQDGDEPPRSFLTASDLISPALQKEHFLDTYYDPVEKCTKWQVNPSHFVVEDLHAGAHLIKNALGGKRRNLFRQVMAMQPPLSRAVRDDISVYVWFFGRGGEEEVKAKLEAGLKESGAKEKEGGKKGAGWGWWPSWVR